MNKILAFTLVLLAGLMAAGQPAFADDFAFDIDAKFRAKIAKEKAKAASNRSTSNKVAKSDAPAQCGSQNIGNVDTGGRIGAAPREVFIFAPNAINLVSGLGCK